MKRVAVVLLAALLLALGALAWAESDQPAETEQGLPVMLYVNRDSLKIYEGPSKDNKYLIKLKGGTAVTLNEKISDDWYAVSYSDGNGNWIPGFAQAKYLSETMPQHYCKHAWPEWTVVQEATCTEKGLTCRTCTVCGKTENKELKKLGHSYGDWVIEDEASCDAAGLKSRVCERCGKREERKIDPLPHDFGPWKVTVEATCTEPGEQTHECEECGFIETVETELAPHTYGSWNLLTEPTCTSTGERVRRCVLCGYRDAQELDALPHEFGAWRVTIAPSCTAKGQRVHRCLICGTQEVETLDALPHEYGDWAVTKAASCTEKGARTRTCRMCGNQQRQEIDMLPHDYTWTVTTMATDHSAGTRSLRCTVCGNVSRQEDFDPDGTLRKGARGDAVRKIQQLLADQGYLNAGGVDGSYGGATERALIQFQKDQGLIADGIAWPQTQKRLNHEFGDWSIQVRLTRSQDAVYARTCKDCGYQEQVTIEAGRAIERGKRGEDVRAVQRMLNDLGFNCGTADGAYGPKLDTAFEAFAVTNNVSYTPRMITPENVDALVNEWVAGVPANRWMGQGGQNSPVRLILTVNQETGSDIPDMLTYSWKLTNMGTENCHIDAILLGFGDNHAFTSNNLAVAIDGAQLTRGGGNSVSGTFTVAAYWGSGAVNICAAATSDKTGSVWLSNARVFER